MKKYPKYKESGVEWIGQIPSDWKIKQLKHLAEVMPSNVDKKSQEDEQKVFLCNYVDVYKNNFITSDLSFMEATASDAQIEKFTLQKGDVIATKDSEDTNDIAIPALVKENFKDVVCGYHLTLMRSNRKEMIGEYLYWLINSKNYNHYFSLEANGVTRYGIGTYSFKNVNVVFPKIDEQTHIAKYLEYKTKRIEALIANKQKLIGLLQEERTSVISQAITKGINPKVKLKPSGVEWLGDVPEHWDVKKLKYIVFEPLKYGANEAAEEDNIEDPRYIRITDFGNDGELRSETFKSLPMIKAENYLLKSGDILFARSGATVGKTFLFKNYFGQACFAGYLIKASCNPKIMLSDFLYEFTNSSGYDNWKQSIFQQATIQNIGADKYNQLKLGVPPLIEQQKIIDFIKSETIRINTIITKTEQEIELMKEYKTALISEVVTGKVDVRDEKIK